MIMKAEAFNQFGGIEVLTSVEIPKPMPKDDEVLVKVKAVSINPLDWKIRKGEMKLMTGSKFPKLMGIDFSGVVAEIGANVNDFRVGDAVFGAVNGMKGGALSEYVAIKTTSIWKKPVNIDFAQAAAIPVVGAGAYMALVNLGKIKPGQSVLLNGATGGVGMFAIQIAKRQKAHVTTVSNTEGLVFAQQWGADVALDYTKTDIRTYPQTFDLIFDLSGKLPFKVAEPLLAAHGIYINPVPEPIDILKTAVTNLFTAKKNKVLMSNPSAESMNYLSAAVEQGLQIEIGKKFSFDDVQNAYRYVEQGGIIGKAVIEI
jgi:NADPH:quinone reductase-like Zn-dependent oxidoreductase